MSKMMTLNFEQKPLKKGTWSAEEDQRLIAYINRYGIWNWNEMPKAAGLFRSGKSCRLRWMNYLRPDIKRGNFTNEEDELILNLHGLLGNRWSAIAAKLGGRTDNEIKNHWHTYLKKRYAVQETKQQVVQNPHQVEMKYDLSFFTSPNASNSKNIILISPELSPSGFSSINSNPPAIEADHEIEQSFSVQDLEDQMWVDAACIDCPYVSPSNSSSEYSSLWTGNNINHQTIEENVNSSEDVYFQSSPMEVFDTMEYNINGATTYLKDSVYSYTYSQIAAENNLFDCTGLSEEMPRLWEKEQSVPLQVTDQEDYFGVIIRGLWQ